MPSTTDCRAYPFPLDADLIDVAGDIMRLANKVDDDVCDVLANLEAKVSVSGDTMTGMLTLPGTNPTSVNHAVRKGWVDATFVNKNGDSMSGDLDMNNNMIHGLDVPTLDHDAARKLYVDNVFADAVSKSSPANNQTMLSGLTAARFVMTDPDAPDGPSQATPKSYVDALVSGVLNPPVVVEGNITATRLFATDLLRVGQNPLEGQPGVDIYDGGRINVYRQDAGYTMMLSKALASADVGEKYIIFQRTGLELSAIRIDDTPPTEGGGTVHITISNAEIEAPSDYRLKERVGPITDATTRIQRLAHAAFRGRFIGATGDRDMLNAHDIAAAVPAVVTGEKDGEQMQQVNYAGMVPTLVAALGAALDRIERLEARLA